MDIKLTVPFGEELTKEAGWIQLDPYVYFIARFHLHIEQHQTGDFAVGDILRTYRTTPYSQTEVEKVFEELITMVDLKETTRSAALSSDLTKKITATVAGAAKSPFYEVSANIVSTLERTVRSSVAESIRSSETVSRRERKTFTVTQTIKSGAQELQYAVAGYRKYMQDVYLHYIDYLFVEYRRTAFGLRRNKHNLPRPVGMAHVNLIPIHIPLFRMFYWQLEPESSLLFTEMEYQSLPKVARPDHVTFEELHESIRLPMPAREPSPTLYTLSNIAFPLRWVDRKGPWTREDLEKIEREEAEGSAWWYQYGPKRRIQFSRKDPSEVDAILTASAKTEGEPEDSPKGEIKATNDIASKNHQLPEAQNSKPPAKGSVSKRTKNERRKKKRSLRVFLCHSSGDKPAVKKLYNKLNKYPWIEPWLDEKNILPGDEWDLTIRQAVRASDIVLVCLSRGAENKEGYLQKEIRQALDVADEKPDGILYIIPLKLEPCAVPERLSKWQWLNYYDADAYRTLLLSLRKRAKDLKIRVN